MLRWYFEKSRKTLGRRFLVDPSIKIGFVLLSRAQCPIPSTRIAVLNMLPFLRAANFDPHIVFEPPQSNESPDVSGLAQKLSAEQFDIVFFQKVRGASVVALANELRALGIKTVFGVCDHVDSPMVEATDRTIVVTDYLKSLHPIELQAKIHTVHDGIEQPLLQKTEYSSNIGSRMQPLRVVLVTSVHLDRLPVLDSPPADFHVDIVGRYAPARERLQRMREIRWTMARQNGLRDIRRYAQFLWNPRISCIAWDARGVYEALQQADIGIIPIEKDPAKGALEGWKVKSENRLTLMMALGLPVIATPIPAYEPLVQQGKNAFLANGKAEWLTCLNTLKDPDLRRSVGQAARRTATDKYSQTRQAEKLIVVLRSLLQSHKV